MCGIAGYITNKKYLNFSFEKASKNLKLIMRNRGPDQQSSFCHASNNYIVNNNGIIVTEDIDTIGKLVISKIRHDFMATISCNKKISY
jgi:asparagine synthetase B (glutamine-hydrolysing)